MRLLSNSVFLLVLIIITGYLLGKIKVKTFSFGSSAVIFVAIVFGYFGYMLPKDFQTLGLVLFIYSIGIQAGPGFISSFRANGIALSIGAAVIVICGFVSSLFCSWFFGFNDSICAGLFTGALTSTPGLAVAVEMVKNGETAAAYGLTYTFGVIGVIIFLKILSRIMNVNVINEEHKIADELEKTHLPMTFRHIEVTNPNLFGKRIDELFLDKIVPVTITRLLRAGEKEPILVDKKTMLKKGDHLRVVGLEENLKKIMLYIGEKIEGEIEFNSILKKRRISVTKPDILGKTLGFLNLRETFNIQVSRITRNGFDIPAQATTRINIGDIFHVVGQEKSLNNIQKHLGNNISELYTINVISIFLGIFIGFLIGQIPLPIPGIGTLKLGTTGGVLVAGLVLSALKKTGTIIWFVPSETNSLIRDIGLYLFLAVVGTTAGATIVTTIKEFGLPLLISGIIVTIFPLIISSFVCIKILKIPFLRMLGVITGGMTSTPGLAATTSISNTPYASTAYATVYPVALIGMIFFTKLIVYIIPH